MNRRGRWIDQFSLYPVRKTIFFFSKVMIGVCLLIYMFASSLFSGWWSDVVFVGLIALLIFAWDAYLRRIVSRPVSSIGAAAQRMADLDFSEPCRVAVGGELGTLAENLNTTADNLQHALAQRKELTDTLSHELKTPLGVIRAYAEGLADCGPERRDAYIEVIVGETEEMAAMINDLLDLSALEAGAAAIRSETFDLVELVEGVAGREYLDAPATGFRLDYILPEHPVYVTADRDRLRQVLHNYMHNAKKFVREGGRIHIGLTEDARFSVYNDGPQLTEEELDAVWEKFYRSRGEENRGGSGLGLAISAQILSMLGAEYGVCNRDEGVEFFFRLNVGE